jgi:ribonuclease T2
MQGRIAAYLFAICLAFSLGSVKPAVAADFDYYVLALSWSPTWCAQHDRDGQTAQCNGNRRYGLVVHGLWPQNERGWPQDCQSDEPDRVPNNLIRSFLDIIPSVGLAGHEWRTHGTCSGLTQQRYFGQLRAAYRKVQLPPVIFNGSIDRNLKTGDIEDLMMSFNPGLQRKGISVSCDQGRLSEIRICMTKSLGFRACSDPDNNACSQRTLTLPPIR